MSNIKKAKGKRKNKKNGGASFSQTSANKFGKANQKMVLFKDIVPPSVIVRLKYIVNRSLNNAGLNTASIQLRANGLYDVDPALASTPVPGFVEWMTMFQKYRVLKVNSKCIYISRDSGLNPIVNMGMGNTFHAANAKTIGYFEGSDQKTTMVSSTASNGRSLSMTRTTTYIVGDEEALAEEQYCGTNATNPVNLWFVSIAADVSYIGAAFVNGVSIRWETEFFAEFYLRRNLFN
jgi:hypothetical protein